MLRKIGILAVALTWALICPRLAAAADPKPAAKPAAADVKQAAPETKPALPAAKPAAAEKEETFAMREVSVFDWKPTARVSIGVLQRGQSVPCRDEPDKQVKVYPKLKSKHPFYGKVTFNATPTDPKSAVEYCFVLDESNEKAAEAKPADSQADDAEEEEYVSPPKTASSGSGKTPLPARTARPPARQPITYDRLYFDANYDLDLTNDPVLLPMKEPPPGARSSQGAVVFDYLSIPFDYGPGLGVRPLRFLPKFTLTRFSDQRYVFLSLVTPVMRQGQIRLGAKHYDALLAQPYSLSGRFDGPWTGLYLTPADSSERERWSGAAQLGALRRVDGKYYTISASPTGDKLTVSPYRGDLGTFRIGPGERKLKVLSMSGSFRSPTSAVCIGYPGSRVSREAISTTQWSLPVGDYLPAPLTVEYGRLQISLLYNYHSDGRPRDAEKQRAYSIHIRKDQPFVLDFSNKPEVVFASPAKDQTFKPNDDLRVLAVLTDPKLGIMIRGLRDTGRKKKEVYKFADGTEQSYRRSVSLDPKVTITNSAGKTLAEGKMPFG